MTTPTSFHPLHCALALALLAATPFAIAFDSGSTGADGAFNPPVSTQVQLPANGVLNYTSVNIPPGVVVTFARNTTNTPVVLLASGDVTIAGMIDVSGGNAAASGASGDGNVGDDGVPGVGGPGGYDGGRGGRKSAVAAENISGAGQGPGGAGASKTYLVGQTLRMCGGSGAGFATTGEAGSYGVNYCPQGGNAIAGVGYGQLDLLPLVGGSGGSGGSGASNYIGAGGGGGGGALLIAASGTLSLTGEIRALGGKGGTSAGQGSGGAGGSGSGGAVRLIATTISGNGPVLASGGPVTTGTTDDTFGRGGAGSVGRIRLEAETISRNAATTPPYTFGEPGTVFVAGLPSLRVLSVAGVDAPAAPTGNADIALPQDTQNPVTIVVATTGVPLGNTVKLVVSPAQGTPIEAVSNALAGTEENATATAQIALPVGPSTLLATVSYSVPEGSEGNKVLSKYTGGEAVDRIELIAAADGTTGTVLHTRSGRRVTLDHATVARDG